MAEVCSEASLAGREGEEWAGTHSARPFEIVLNPKGVPRL